ncbi:MAG: MBL fold metallo-hydrolase [Acidimicrobiaceae bacterium]|nr:MBL fold metallo-hydrolase [Acidimicrobiaceae bacterium]
MTHREPELARITRQGASTDGSTDAVAVTDYIHMSFGVTNSYLITTADRSVIVNAGSELEARRAHLPRYRRIDPRPPAYIITTQSHRDHMGGVPVLSGPDTRWVAHESSTRWRADVRMLHDVYLRRRNVLWSSVLNDVVELGNRAGPDREPDILAGDSWATEVGGRRFELLATPGGETTDSLVVWLPDDGAVFTSNLLGPVFGGMPNLATLRGDKLRSAQQFVSSLERVRDLGPELLVTGHGDPVRGAETIRAELNRISEAVQYVHDRTVEGMLAGRSLVEVMAEAEPPEDLRLPEAHGKASWNARSIWHEYLGWFLMESTTELYPVPASSVATDVVELAGASELAARARAHLDGGRPVEALHLTDIVLHADADHRDALAARAAALQELLERSRGENLSEVMWLRSQIADTDRRMADG